MRELKFRAWDRDNKLMVENVSHIQRDGLVVMQHTGLKDKNGKEIYEGDIVVSSNGAVEGQVVYQAPSFVIKRTPRAKTWFTFDLAPSNRQFQEVIGNMYENKELLK